MICTAGKTVEVLLWEIRIFVKANMNERGVVRGGGEISQKSKGLISLYKSMVLLVCVGGMTGDGRDISASRSLLSFYAYRSKFKP